MFSQSLSFLPWDSMTFYGLSLPVLSFSFLLLPSMAFYILPWPSTSFPGLSLGISWGSVPFYSGFLQVSSTTTFPGWSLSIPVLLFPCVWSAVQLTRTLQERARNAQNIAEPISMHDTMLSPKESPPFLGSLVKSMLICAAFSLDLSLTSNYQTAPPQSP